jgi:peptidoglycan/LPS O-acetylase OafA/YrhL
MADVVLGHAERAPGLEKGKDNSGRLVELDALRGLAALGVLLYHFTSIYPRLISHTPFHMIPSLDFGYFGVELFFIISGCVIFFTLRRAKSISDFAISRFVRLFPTYWAAVLVAVLVELYAGTPEPGLARQAAANFTMLQAFVGVDNLDGSYWTLALELSFYVLLAVAYYLSLKSGLSIEWALIGWLCAATVIRATGFHVPYRLAIFFLLYYGQFFIFGIATYLIYSKTFTRLTWVVLIWAALMSLFGADVRTPAAGFTNYYLGTVGVEAIVIGALFYRPAFLSSRPLKFLGAISYSLYLTHSTVGFLILRLAMASTGSEAIALLLAIGVSIAVAFALNTCVEVPSRLALAKAFGLHRPNLPART